MTQNKATVALPCTKGDSAIIWLALEGLCNQITQHCWELIVYDDAEEPLGESFFIPYKNRLNKAGCERILYMYTPVKLPLAVKWRQIAQYASDTNMFILQAADDYSFNKRIEATLNHAAMGFDWYSSRMGFFYNITQKKLIRYNHFLNNKKTAINIAFKTEFAKQLPYCELNKGVDHFLFTSVSSLKKSTLDIAIDDSQLYASGFFTDGCNHISNREKYYKTPSDPFEYTHLKIEDIAPKYIVDKLNLL